MDTPLFTAETIDLTALDAKADAPALVVWSQDSRYAPLTDALPPRPLSILQAEKALAAMLKEADEKRLTFWFGIRPRGKSELLGIIGLSWVDWANGAVYMDLSMKDRAEYGKDSTREALNLMQRYVFHEIQMHRLSLSAPAYNKTLLTLLAELGFVEEARNREMIFRFGRRWDNIHFGILVSEWEEK